MHKRTRSFHFLPRVVLVSICLTAVVLLLDSSFSAHAAGAGCRTDPIVVLENGKTLRITVQAETNAAQVTFIFYTLHVPPGTRVKQIIYTGGKFRNKESLEIIPDAAPRTFAVDTVVNTKTSVAVSSTTTLWRLKASARGQSGERLSVFLQE